MAASLGLLSGCSSSEQRAATAAAQADQLFSQGLYQPASMLAREAVRLDEDNADYWLILGRIQVAAQAYNSAYVSYQRVLELDRGNIEALSLLTQMAVATRQADRADAYADQLLIVRPDDLTALVSKGRAALLRGDSSAALVFADRVLTLSPGDLGSTILKARVLVAQEKLADAIMLVEQSFAASSGDPEERLFLLRELYIRQWDVAGYERIISRLAQATGASVATRLEYADALYQSGRAKQARAAVARLMQDRPQDATLASQIVDLWQRQGPDAIPADELPALAARASLQMQAAYAQFANIVDRPDLALALLPGALASAETDIANADAKAAFADALRRTGRDAEAAAIVRDVLEFDPNQSRALTVRAHMLAKSGRLDSAIADARQVVGNEPNSPAARLFLATLLFRQGDEALGVGALRAAVAALPREPRPAEALAIHLGKNRRFDQAASVLRGLVRTTPVSRRAVQLRQQLCRRMPPSTCDTPADQTLGPSAREPGATAG